MSSCSRPVRLAVWLLVASAVAHADAQKTETVDINGLQIRVRIDGRAHIGKAPPVVFEAGARSRLETWDTVLSDVSTFAPTLAYDRPGNGESTPDDASLHPLRVADNLHALLARVGLEPPYVLVGHSWGGPLIRVFAGRFPKDIAGLVYVDPTDMRSREEDVAYFSAQGYSGEGMAARQAEFRKSATGETKVILGISDGHFAELQTLPQPRVPTTVLMSTRFDSSIWSRSPCEPLVCQENWIRFRTKWLRSYLQNTNDQGLVASERGGHYLQTDEPVLVVTAIRRVIGAARSGM